MIKKHYNTKLFLALVKLFKSSKKPISYSTIEEQLVKSAVIFNRSTLYRQLASLEKSKQIQSIFSLKGQLWQKYNKVKHAHLECQNCHKITCLDFGSINISNKNNFQINSINLIGLCAQCL
jgi:Fur family transcriptional regulator, ferric uptake regulator